MLEKFQSKLEICGKKDTNVFVKGVFLRPKNLCMVESVMVGRGKKKKVYICSNWGSFSEDWCGHMQGKKTLCKA